MRDVFASLGGSEVGVVIAGEVRMGDVGREGVT